MIDFFFTHSVIYYIIVPIFSHFITFFIIPSIIHVSHKRHLYDDLGQFRKQHDHGIPRLGGVAIFVSFTITTLLFTLSDNVLPINYLLTGCIILFSIGLKDDLSGVNPSTKFSLQFIVAIILVTFGNVRLTSLYGVFEVYDLSYAPSVVLSVLIIVLIVNSFNLIDGVDGLAASSGIVVNGTFAILFICMHQYQLAIISLAMVGAIAGFLKYNFTPARIFMGDTGALLIGLISSVVAIKFMGVSNQNIAGSTFYFSPFLALVILIGPIFDTFRVFIVRILNGNSPFQADRNHMHHRLQKLGLSHLQITSTLALVNILCIAMVLFLQDFTDSIAILLIVVVFLLSNWMITFYIRSKEREHLSFRNLFA